MLYATNIFPGDGSTRQFEITFVGGYLNKSHVKVYVEDAVTKMRRTIDMGTVTWIGPYTIQLPEATPVGSNTVIARQTPLLPIVDFQGSSRITEANLDVAHRQGLFVATESLDSTNSKVVEELKEVLLNTETWEQATADAATASAQAGVATTKAAEAASSAAAAAASVGALALSTGSGNVGHIGSGTGAVATTVQSKLRESVSVRDFGAVGDGVTDDTAAIQAAIEAVYVAGGGTVYIPASMTLKCTARIFGKHGVSIKSESNSWLDFRGAGWLTPTNDLSLFGYYGTAGSFIYPAVDMVAGTNKITVPDAAVFSVGDMVELSMNSNGRWNDTSVAVTAGQLAIVTGVYTVTNSVVLSEPLYETLTTANSARIRVINPIENITIEGLGIIGNGRNPSGNADQGIKVCFGRNVKIKNCRLQAVDTQSIGVVSCYGAEIYGNRVDDVPLGDVDYISYGIVYSSSMHVKIHDNHSINSRHGVVSSHLSGSYGYYGINRFVEIYNNTHTSNYGALDSAGFTRAHAGISTHTDAEFIDIRDNTVVGCRYGINTRTPNNSIKGNRVDSCGIGIYFSEYWADTDASNNILTNCRLAFSTDTSPYEVPRGSVDIVDNVITACGGSSFTHPLIGGSVLRIDGNVVRKPHVLGITAIFSVYNNCDLSFVNNDIEQAGTFVLRTASTGRQIISENIITETKANVSASLFVVTATNFVIRNNVITRFAGNTSAPLSCPTKLTAPLSVVSGNQILGA